MQLLYFLEKKQPISSKVVQILLGQQFRKLYTARTRTKTRNQVLAIGKHDEAYSVDMLVLEKGAHR